MTNARQSVVDETNCRYQGWLVAAACGVGVLFVSTAFVTFAVFLKPLSEEHGWSREAVSAAFGAMTLGSALSAPIIGALVDRFGPRTIWQGRSGL